MPEWLLTLLIGGIIVGLIGVIYQGVLTKSEHAEVCKNNTRIIQNDIKTTIKEEMEEIKKYFDLKLENEILKEIKKINHNDNP